MSVYKPKGSPSYHFDFWHGGSRFYGSTGCTKRRDAEAVERDEREKARHTVLAKQVASSVVSLQMNHVAERYWQEIGQFHSGSNNTERDLARLVEYFGKTKLLSEIDDNDVTQLIAWRRGHRVGKGKTAPLISKATVNRSTTEVLKKLFTRAKGAWRVRFDAEPNWRVHFLPEPQERVRELHGDEGERLDAATRADYEPFFGFAKASGLRRKEAVYLRWSEVNWDSGKIVKLGKGGKRVTVTITPLVRDILEPLKGHHPEFVFTYVAQRTIPERKKGETHTRTCKTKKKGERYIAKRDQEARVKGRRYPLTYDGAKTEWRRLREEAGVEDLRFHDLRHNLATKLLRQTGNLKLVSRALNHADLKTTMRYAHVLDEDVAIAMTLFHESLRPKRDLETASLQETDTESREKSRNAC